VQDRVIDATIRGRLKCNDTLKVTDYSLDVWFIANRCTNNIMLGKRFNQINWVHRKIQCFCAFDAELAIWMLNTHFSRVAEHNQLLKYVGKNLFKCTSIVI
jgi:hypothetical protein